MSRLLSWWRRRVTAGAAAGGWTDSLPASCRAIGDGGDAQDPCWNAPTAVLPRVAAASPDRPLLTLGGEHRAATGYRDWRHEVDELGPGGRWP